MANEISKIKLPGSTTEYIIKDNSAITDITRDGTTFTATKRDGTEFTFTQQDDNTTYTFATGDNNGQIKVTPSGGTAQNVSVKGLGAAAYKGTTISVTSGSSDLVTSGAVYTAIDNLPEPMIFKGSLGTGGTITTLPTASSANEGFTYKVITEGTYASQVAKIGDLFISNGTDWIWIPSGDEPSGTVTSVAAGTGLDGGTITTSGTLSVKYGTAAGTACQGNDSRLSDARTPTSHTHGNIQNGGTLQTNDITIASGDKLVVTDSSDSAKVARTSISFDGSTTTKALTQKGTWETYTIVKVSNTDPSTPTYYYPTWSTDTSSTGELKANDGFKYHSLQGTTSSDGYGRLILGNAISTGTAGNKYGYITLYSHKSGTSTIIPTEDTEMHWTHTLPKVTGTIGVFSETPAGGQVIICSTSSNAGAIKPSGYTINASVPSNAVFTDTTYTLSADTTNNKIKLTPSSGNAQSITVPYATSAGSATKATQDGSGNIITSTYVKKSGDTMTGVLTMGGNDFRLGTSGSSSDDSSDIAWYYGNGQEKARLWTQNEYTAKSGLNYRVYKKDGTSLYNGTIPLADGTGASGTWSISVSGNAGTANKLGSSDVGSATQPIYLSAGTATACTYTLGKSVPSDAVFTDTNNAVTQTATSTNANYEVLFSNTADNTTRTETARKSGAFIFNPTRGLRLGESSQSVFPTVGIHVHDVRSVNFTPGALDQGANFFFSNNTMPNTNWWAGLHVKGWTGAYAAWEIVGSAHNNDSRTTPLYVRTSNLASTWGSWRKIYDTSNPPTKSEVGLSNVDNTADANKSVSYATTSGTATGANKLNSIAAIGTASQTHAQALKTYFDANKTTIPRNVGINFYSSAYNNGANCFGYFLNSYDDNPYGGFFISHYDKAYYVGINSGNYTQNLLGRFTADPTSGQVVVTDGTTGGIKSSGYTIAKSVPSNAVFTDTNNAVTQTATTTSANYELLFSATADNTTRTEGARKTDSLKYNPSTKEMTLDGTIVLNGYSRATSTDPSPSIILKANNIDTDTAVSTRTYGDSEINAHDKDGDRLGFINWFKDADGSIGFTFAAQNKSTGGNNQYNTFEMRVDKTGNRSYSITDAKAFRTAINTTTCSFTKSISSLAGATIVRRGNVVTLEFGHQITSAGSYTNIGTVSPAPIQTLHFVVNCGGSWQLARINTNGVVSFNNPLSVAANAYLIGSCTYITAD